MNASISRSRTIVTRLSRPTSQHSRLCNFGQRVLRSLAVLLLPVVFFTGNSPSADAQRRVPDQHSTQWHNEDSLPLINRPPGMTPVTVASEDALNVERLLPLDEALSIALQNAEVIRVLTGVSAVNSGRTIYDAAISTTGIDNAVSEFDPVFRANSAWRKTETVGTRLDLLDPLNAVVSENTTGANDFTMLLRRRNRLGGTAAMQFSNNWRYQAGVPGGLTKRNSPGLELSYTQPLLAGAGRAANEAPIVIAQLNVDRSFFAYKGSMQQLVQGVIAAYWSLVAARTDLWARENQVKQAAGAFERVKAQFDAEIANIAEVAQPRLALANFEANLVSARANVIQREAALRNLLGLPPEDGQRLVPSTPPTREQLQFQWVDLVETAQRKRPDLIELNLVLMADQQRRLQADNLARPNLDAQAIQSWNGLRGRALNGNRISSDLNDSPSWTLGVTFEVPLGLRNARATLRNRELVIARDRANLVQGLHQAEHDLATTVRSLDQFYAQYEAFRETRAAALQNLEAQLAYYRNGTAIFLNVLQAISAWGDAVSSEANALTQYNTALASLEESTGTILDTHGIVFSEERYAAMGPCGRKFEDACYPKSLRPQQNTDRYQEGDEPSEEAFNLKDFQGEAIIPKSIPYDENPVPADGRTLTPFESPLPLDSQPNAASPIGPAQGAIPGDSLPTKELFPRDSIFHQSSFQSLTPPPSVEGRLRNSSQPRAVASSHTETKAPVPDNPSSGLRGKLKNLFRRP